MTDQYVRPPMQVVLWSQPADTLLPDVYEFQRKTLDPTQDRHRRIRIAREIGRYTANPPAPKVSLGSGSWVMRWRSFVNRGRLFRVLADIRTDPLTDRPAPNAITLYVLFDLEMSASPAGDEAAERLKAFARMTGQSVDDNLLGELREQISKTNEYKRPAILGLRHARPSGSNHDLRQFDRTPRIQTKDSE